MSVGYIKRVKAEMTSQSVYSQISEEFLVCQICFEAFTKPKVLPCLHTFCEVCLMRVVPNRSKTIPCPMCRCETLLPENGVAGLKDNFFILNLSDAFTQKEDSSNRKAFCTVCPGSDPAEASSRCLECVDFLCDNCAATHDHRIARFTRRHRVISLSGEGGQSSQKKTRYEAPCLKHDTETLRFFCETCDTPICRDCILIEHRDHTHTYLKDEVAKHKNVIDGLMKDVREKISAFQDVCDNVEEVEANLIANRGQAEYIIQKTVEDFVSSIKKQEEELKKKLDRICTSRLKHLAAHKDSLKSGLENLTDGFEFTERALQHGSDIEILSIKDQVVDRLQGISQISPQQDLTLERLSHLYFIASDNLHNPKMHPLGEIKYEFRENGNSSDTLPASPQESSSESKEAESQKGGKSTPESQKMKLVMELNDSTHDGGEFDWPSGVAATEDGEYLVVADRDNDRIQVYNKDGKFECKFGSHGKRNGQFELPLDVAVSEEDDTYVFITDEYNHRVQKFTLYGQYILHFGDNGTLKQPYGIAVDKKRKQVVVSDIGKHRITIHDLDGNLVHSFGSRGDDDVKFNEPRYVAVDNHHDHIIVSDHCNHCMKIFDITGKHIRTVGSCGTGPGQFIGPTGVCLDEDGNIIVADCADRVQLFSPEGKFLRLIGSEMDGISGPLGMANTKDGMLVVTNLGTHKVNAFKYSN
ncbi:tripartite motif-containing protein 3-like [Ptychodera flava]|uniref:tripartite motif-containing protein 3-like n=1 Tax=Ptychodera flava TaxID=63121 RepID=UPI00396A3A8A